MTVAEDPLHQFVIEPLLPLHVAGLDLSFTNSSLWMVIGVVASTGLMALALRPKALVPGRAQMVMELFYALVEDMLKTSIGHEGKRYRAFIFTVFTFVLMGNLMGLIPYSFTYTSHIIVTAALAFTVFGGVIFLGFKNHGMHFLRVFVPPDIPFLLYFLLVPIEFVSYMARPLTHGLRLFANMVAGHIMLKVFAGFTIGLMTMGLIGIAGGFVPVFINAVLIGFELLIALLQAYVFAILACIYLKDTVDISH
jgi:F-type H+-transporting ATPase subunit a